MATGAERAACLVGGYCHRGALWCGDAVVPAQVRPARAGPQTIDPAANELVWMRTTDASGGPDRLFDAMAAGSDRGQERLRTTFYEQSNQKIG
jgi:hypothetical protein